MYYNCPPAILLVVTWAMELYYNYSQLQNVKKHMRRFLPAQQILSRDQTAAIHVLVALTFLPLPSTTHAHYKPALITLATKMLISFINLVPLVSVLAVTAVNAQSDSGQTWSVPHYSAPSYLPTFCYLSSNATSPCSSDAPCCSTPSLFLKQYGIWNIPPDFTCNR
jgi:hypothetical protein